MNLGQWTVMDLIHFNVGLCSICYMTIANCHPSLNEQPACRSLQIPTLSPIILLFFPLQLYYPSLAWSCFNLVSADLSLNAVSKQCACTVYHTCPQQQGPRFRLKFDQGDESNYPHLIDESDLQSVQFCRRWVTLDLEERLSMEGMFVRGQNSAWGPVH